MPHFWDTNISYTRRREGRAYSSRRNTQGKRIAKIPANKHAIRWPRASENQRIVSKFYERSSRQFYDHNDAAMAYLQLNTPASHDAPCMMCECDDAFSFWEIVGFSRQFFAHFDVQKILSLLKMGTDVPISIGQNIFLKRNVLCTSNEILGLILVRIRLNGRRALPDFLIGRHPLACNAVRR